MSIILVAGAAAIFAAGAAVGSALSLALAKDKLAAMTEAAERANAIIMTQSEGALKDLADAHARTEAMIAAIETAKHSTARAETSVTNLISKIHLSRESLEKVARRDWFPSLARQNRSKTVSALKTPPAIRQHDAMPAEQAASGRD